MLRKGTSEKNIFFIHGGSGSIGGYVNIFRDNNIPLNEEFNCYAIKFNKLDGYSPVKISIEELAEEYVRKILLIQPDGEYYLAAWCIGGQIIYEMATILENKLNKQVNSVIMFNSIAPKEWDTYYNFELNDEIAYIKGILAEKIDLDGIDKVQSIRDLWQHIIEVIKNRGDEVKKLIPKEILHSIPNYQSLNISEIIYYINSMRSLHNARANYYPKNRLKSQVHYFKPLRDTTIDDHEENINRWQQYCDKKIHKVEVYADEHSIFDEDINNTIKMLNDILN